jgi:RNA polymerase sigma-54 factor
MALAPKLQARQGAQLAMTPQLQQAIKLLQLSNIELSAFVEEQLEKNPLLERGTGDENRRGEAVEVASKDADLSTDKASSETVVSDMDTPDHALAPESTAADVGGSVDWSRNDSNGSFSGSSDYDPAANSSAEITLADHIQGQLPLLKFSDKDRLIADYLAGQVDEAGYLRMSVEEAAENLGVDRSRVSSILADWVICDIFA